MGPDIAQLMHSCGGAIRRADHPELSQRLDRLRRGGELVSPLPGVLCMPSLGSDFTADLAVGNLWAGPDAVLTGRAAARLTFLPDVPVRQISYAIPRRQTVTIGRWTKSFRVVPPEHVWDRNGILMTSPACTAVDLASEENGGDVIDGALRSRRATLDQMWEVLRSQPNRPGNQIRAALLKDSRDRPWSEGERELHRALRRRGITGWQTNCWIPVGGSGFYADILFRTERLIVEFDGFRYHAARSAFDDDRFRRNELVLAGYRVLNFTWRQLTDNPEWVLDCVRRALDGRRR
jgi:very-short-patch-repair endonuclease